jgi:CO dehydrogenase nickel-insertion accessory protein CooC1
MKYAFLGKGGSGKSTLATALTLHFANSGYATLAIDADHNMDLTYNLGIEPTVFLGTDPDNIKEYVGVSRNDTFALARNHAELNNITFSISPVDAFTNSMSVRSGDFLRIMTAGPHTPSVRMQESCSHSLAAPLKVYLPRLQLSENQRVVIDERAGTDPVATGILGSVDLAIIVEENTVQGKRVAEQIRHELVLASIPHIVVRNKVDGIEQDIVRVIETIMNYSV